MSAPTAPLAAGGEQAPSRATLAAVDRLRRSLDAIVWVRALAQGGVVAMVVLVAARLALMAGAPVADTPLLHTAWLAVAAGVLAAAARRWRDGRLDRTRAALWAEEQAPRAFAIVTAVEPQRADVRALLEPRLSDVPWSAVAGRAARRALLPSLAALIVLSAVILLLPEPAAIMGARAAAAAARGEGAGSPMAAPGAGVGAVTVVVRPPAYSGLPVRTERDPASVSALVGSAVRMDGRTAGALRARDGDAPLAVSRDDDRWSVSLTMPERPVVATLSAGGRDRLVLLTPVMDSTPTVTLAQSVRDTVLRAPTGTIALAAEARDDLGLASGGFEYIVSSGEGESFTFRGGTVGQVTLGGARKATLRADLRLDGLALGPGDIVHVRALARDANSLGGPGVGSSETRTIRIARLGEYDSLAVEGAPPAEADSAALSQRMLLIQTEKLEEDRPRIARDSLMTRARRISSDQTRLRKQVGEMVYMRLGDDVGGEHSHFPGDGHEHGAEGRLDPDDILARASAATGGGEPVALDFHGDETPVVAVNKPLLEAYNHMWDATRALDVGEPARAIPPMHLALAALQRARQAERIYLRGRPPAVVVDVAHARLQGRTRGEDNARAPRPASDPAAALRAERLERALRLLAAGDSARPDAAALDSLTVLRADALTSDAALAAALGTALDRLRAGEDAGAALRRARRLATGAPVTRGGLRRWGGLP